MKKKSVRRSIVTGLMMVLTALLCMGVKAKASDFDAAYYAAKYPDVVAVYGTDASALYSHYLTFGINENRFKNAEEEKSGKQEITDTSGLTYVDVDIANQTMIFYQAGVPVLSSPIVTGNINNGNETPTGTFFIDTKIPGKYLTGPTWHVWVDRWMKFTGCVGLHDANWRGKFGGDIYKSNGSHGCVNLPSDVAYKLYDMVDIGTMVVVH